MSPDMNPDLNIEVLRQLRERCRVRLAEGRIWPEILEELEDDGYRPLDLRLVLRSMNAWAEQARLLKANGWPYDDLVLYLSNLLATGQDIAWALLEAGLQPADMLRAVLPEVIGTEFQATVIQTAFERGHDAEECRRVVAWCLGASPE
jgi:hypothetical protein